MNLAHMFYQEVRDFWYIFVWVHNYHSQADNYCYQIVSNRLVLWYVLAIILKKNISIRCLLFVRRTLLWVPHPLQKTLMYIAMFCSISSPWILINCISSIKVLSTYCTYILTFAHLLFVSYYIAQAKLTLLGPDIYSYSSSSGMLVACQKNVLKNMPELVQWKKRMRHT